MLLGRTRKYDTIAPAKVAAAHPTVREMRVLAMSQFVCCFAVSIPDATRSRSCVRSRPAQVAAAAVPRIGSRMRCAPLPHRVPAARALRHYAAGTAVGRSPVPSWDQVLRGAPCPWGVCRASLRTPQRPARRDATGRVTQHGTRPRPPAPRSRRARTATVRGVHYVCVIQLRFCCSV